MAFRQSFITHVDDLDSEDHREGRRAGSDEPGFTLVELLIVSVLIPIIVGAISLALLSTFRVQSGITDRLSSTGDTQATSATFFRDVQNATYLTTSATPAVQCGSASPILSLEWTLPTQYATLISYSVVPNGIVIAGYPEYQLVRSECVGVKPSTSYPSGVGLPVIDIPTSAAIVSQNVPGPNSPSTLGGALAAVVNCVTGVTCPDFSAGWRSVAGVRDVNFHVNASLSSNPVNNPGNNYSYDLTASPRSLTSGSGNSAGIAPLELVNNASQLNGCSSGSLVNVNGAMLLQSSATVSSKDNTINTAAVYYTTTKPSPTKAFVGASATPALVFTKLPHGYTDPFAGLSPPDPNTLLPQSTLGQPGVYSSKVSVSTMVTLAPGIYYFTDGTSLKIQGSGSGITGRGVLLYFAGNASFTVGANSTVNLEPMTGGTYAGLTVWQGGSGSVSWDGNANNSYLNGVIYSPHGTVTIDGTDNVFASNIIANNLNCNGGGHGSINIGYTQIPATRESLSFTTTPTGTTVGQTYTVIAVDVPPLTSPPPNQIIYSIDPTSTSSCSISNGNLVTFATAGTCVVDANQAGTGPYYAAIEIQQSITVTN